MSDGDREDWLRQRAKATVPYLDGERIKFGGWITLRMPDGCSMSLPEKDWPDIERIALEIRG